MNQKTSSSLSFDQFQKIISCIYDAALDPELWENVIQQMSITFKADQGYMRVINTKSSHVQHVYAHNKDAQWEKPYKDYYIHKDPWLNDILKSKESFISCTHHYLSNKEYEALEFHRDFVVPQKTHYGMGGKIDIGKNITSYWAFNRDRVKQPFENTYYKTLKFLTPHLQKALLINNKTHQIKLKQNLLRDALNQINNPLLLVNKNGKILFINTQAEQLINQQSFISIKNNHILILSKAENTNLHKLIHQATDNLPGKGGGMNYIHPFTQTSLSILVTPVNPDRANIDTQSNENALLLLSTNNYQPSIPTELLVALYKLTPAEARLTEYLYQGLTLNEISVKVSLSKHTLRTQLRSCFNKTGVSRQAELVRLISVGPAGIVKAAI